MHELQSRQSRHRRTRPLGQGADPCGQKFAGARDRPGLQPLGGKPRGVRAGVRHQERAGPRDAPEQSRHQGRDPHRAERAAPAARARGRQGRQARLHREADRLDARGRPADRGAGEDLWRQRHGRPQRAADGRHPRDRQGHRGGRARPRRLHGGEFLQRAGAGADARRPGAGTRTARRAGRCRSSRSTSSTSCIISAARSSRPTPLPPSCRRSAPRSTTSR